MITTSINYWDTRDFLSSQRKIRGFVYTWKQGSDDEDEIPPLYLYKQSQIWDRRDNWRLETLSIRMKGWYVDKTNEFKFILFHIELL